MHLLVRIIVDDDGETRHDSGLWHLVEPGDLQEDAVLCTGEAFGTGESSCEYETKTMDRGGTTC